MERKRRGNDRCTMAMVTAVVFTAGGKVEMEKKSRSSPPRFARLRSGNGEEAMQLGGGEASVRRCHVEATRRRRPVLVGSLGLSLSAVTVLDGGEIEYGQRRSDSERLPCGSRAKGTRLE
jgi:hypothetical protein